MEAIMPKYAPTEDDLCETSRLCPVCGGYIYDEDAETCGLGFCRMQWEAFKKDYEQMELDNFLKKHGAK
jgi:hypothetical protein